MRYGLRDLIRHYGLHSRSVALFLLASVLVQSTMGALNVILNLYILQLGFGEDFAGMLMSVKLVTSGLMCIPVGIACARRGVRRGLLTATVALGGGVLLLGITANPFWLVAGAALIGVAQAGKAVSEAPFLVENSDPRIRQNLFSLHFALMMFSNMAGNALSGFLPRLWPQLLAGYAGTLQLYGVLALSALVPLWWVAAGRGNTKVAAWDQLGRGLRLVRANPALSRLLFCHALIGFGAGLIVPLFNSQRQVGGQFRPDRSDNVVGPNSYRSWRPAGAATGAAGGQGGNYFRIEAALNPLFDSHRHAD